MTAITTTAVNVKETTTTCSLVKSYRPPTFGLVETSLLINILVNVFTAMGLPKPLAPAAN
jgi:hypothetical protein